MLKFYGMHFSPLFLMLGLHYDQIATVAYLTTVWNCNMFIVTVFTVNASWKLHRIFTNSSLLSRSAICLALKTPQINVKSAVLPNTHTGPSSKNTMSHTGSSYFQEIKLHKGMWGFPTHCSTDITNHHSPEECPIRSHAPSRVNMHSARQPLSFVVTFQGESLHNKIRKILLRKHLTPSCISETYKKLVTTWMSLVLSI
jgi:hypothetical protein